MDHVTFYEAYDNRFETVVVQGYKVHYREAYDGYKYEYLRLRSTGAGGELVEKSFHFEDDEYITHIGTANVGSLDRIEFVTN